MDNVISLKVVSESEVSRRGLSELGYASLLDDFEVAIAGLARLGRGFSNSVAASEYLKLMTQADAEPGLNGIPEPQDIYRFISKLKMLRNILFGGLVNWDLGQAELAKQVLNFSDAQSASSNCRRNAVPTNEEAVADETSVRN